MKIIFDKLEPHPPHGLYLEIGDEQVLRFWLIKNNICVDSLLLKYNDFYHFYHFEMFPEKRLWEKETYEELAQRINEQKDRLSEILQKDGYTFDFVTTWWWHTDLDENPCLPGLKRQIPGFQVVIYPMNCSLSQIDNQLGKV